MGKVNYTPWEIAANNFAKSKHTKVSWWTYAGYSPEEVSSSTGTELFFPFGIKGQDAEYRVIIRNGEYVVIVNNR